MDNNELMHYGVPGMKWGVRRTPAQFRSKPSNKKSTPDQKVRKARKSDLNKRRTMSDADLKKKIERMKLEKEFKSLTQEDIAPGRKFVTEVMSSAGKKALTAAAAGAMAYSVKVAMTKEFSIRDAASYIASNPNKKK